MPEVVLAVMAVATVAYVTLGGADFGAGMVEPFLPQHHRERLSVAIAPVWEANHVWLVLVAVLAFVGFPRLYSEATTFLHIPVLFILLGIVARGSAFTFRHYDPSPGRLGPVYSSVFRLSSYMTPLFIGVAVAAMVDGRIGGCAAADFHACFVAPWNSVFTWATGAFVCALFAFQGAALLAAEHAHGDRLPYLRLTRALHLITVATGAGVFLAGWASSSPWLSAFLASPVGPMAMGVASLLVPAVAYAFHRGRPQVLRLVLGAQTSAILVGFFGPGFPVLLRMADGHHVRFPEDAAPPAVMTQLVIAVGVGLVLILPSLTYLILVYKRRAPAADR